MRSIFDAIRFAQSIVAKTITASENGTAVSVVGYNTACAVIAVGDIDKTTGDETYAFKVQEGNLADGSDAGDIAGAAGTITADNTVLRIRLDNLGRKKFLRIVATLGGTTPSCPLVAGFNLGRAYQEPV